MATGMKNNHKKKSMELVRFIEEHYDMVSQEDYFDMCDMVLDLVQDLAVKEGWASALVKESSLFEAASG